MKTWTLAWGLAAAIVLAYGAALACSVIGYTGVTAGFLGVANYTAPQGLHVPRNVAIASMASLPAAEPAALQDDVGDEIELEPVAGTVWWTPVAPLEPGAHVQSGVVGATVDDVIDETLPSAPSLTRARVHVVESGRGCLRPVSTCEGMETLYLTIEESSDDYSPPERITYAMFGGSTASEAEAAELPIRLLVTRPDTSELVETWGMLDTDPIQWVAIAAVDQAGNVSARTAPVRLSR
jgi:hypothetical protein